MFFSPLSVFGSAIPLSTTMECWERQIHHYGGEPEWLFKTPPGYPEWMARVPELFASQELEELLIRENTSLKQLAKMLRNAQIIQISPLTFHRVNHPFVPGMFVLAFRFKGLPCQAQCFRANSNRVVVAGLEIVPDNKHLVFEGPDRKHEWRLSAEGSAAVGDLQGVGLKMTRTFKHPGFPPWTATIFWPATDLALFGQLNRLNEWDLSNALSDWPVTGMHYYPISDQMRADLAGEIQGFPAEISVYIDQRRQARIAGIRLVDKVVIRELELQGSRPSGAGAQALNLHFGDDTLLWIDRHQLTYDELIEIAKNGTVTALRPDARGGADSIEVELSHTLGERRFQLSLIINRATRRADLRGILAVPKT